MNIIRGCSMKKQTEAKIEEILRLKNEERKSDRAVAKILKMSYDTVGKILKQENWEHFPPYKCGKYDCNNNVITRDPKTLYCCVQCGKTDHMRRKNAVEVTKTTCALPECDIDVVIRGRKDKFCSEAHCDLHFSRVSRDFYYKKLFGKLGKCIACDETNIVTIHHIEHTNGKSNKNSETIILCPTHHDYIHKNLAVYENGVYSYIYDKIVKGIVDKNININDTAIDKSLKSVKRDVFLGRVDIKCEEYFDPALELARNICNMREAGIKISCIAEFFNKSISYVKKCLKDLNSGLKERMCLLKECGKAFMPVAYNNFYCCASHYATNRCHARHVTYNGSVCSLPECDQIVYKKTGCIYYCSSRHAQKHFKRVRSGFYKKILGLTSGCIVCGENRIVNEHHTDFTNKGSNKKGPTVLLCPTHHMYIHSKWAKIENDNYIFTIDSYRAKFRTKYPDFETTGKL